MSRSNSIQALLRDPELRVRSIKPSGDCFYEAVAAALETIGEDVRDCSGVEVENGDSAALALRRTVAARVDQEVLDQFTACHQAGLPDYSFMRRVRSIEQLQDLLRVSGAGAGAGSCIWANEWEIRLLLVSAGVKV